MLIDPISVSFFAASNIYAELRGTLELEDPATYLDDVSLPSQRYGGCEPGYACANDGDV